MSLKRILTIIDKEWAEVFKNRVVLMTIVVLPLVFTVLPLGILYATRSGALPGGSTTDLPPQFERMCAQAVGATGGECMQIFIVDEFLLLFMMMPLAIPVAIAAYSIVGEKTTRSLEPLLATPITTEELLAAKGLAAALPAILATWGAFALFVLGMPLVGATPAVYRSLFSPTWLVAVLLVGPLLAALAVNFAIIVSSRVSDPRTAEQVSMVIIVPLIAMLFGQVAGVLVLNAGLMLGVAGGLAVLDVGLIYLGGRWFQRETILTRWK
jgi:ABC-2 type transport system permease protein